MIKIIKKLMLDMYGNKMPVIYGLSIV